MHAHNAANRPSSATWRHTLTAIRGALARWLEPMGALAITGVTLAGAETHRHGTRRRD